MDSKRNNKRWILGVSILTVISMLWAAPLLASEAELEIPVLTEGQNTVLMIGLLICALGMAFGAYEYVKVKKFPAHKSMLDVADIIFQTCKTYLIQQGKLLIILEIFIGICIAYYFGFLQHTPVEGVLIILAWSVVGILGSYGVAWFGIRMNTLANSRMAFASLEGKPIKLLDIPLRAGMSIGVLLVCVELIMMLIILVFMPRQYAGACFIGFAIGESLGASALRICGGIFTKIADIGSDLMKIVFNLKEDDPRNPGVIADCTGDNAGDSVGPTADGFETYGVTGVALICFIVLGVFPQFQAELITWIFVMRILMIVTSIVAYLINKGVTTSMFAGKAKIDFELPLTMLVWFTSILSIIVTFAVSYWQIGHLPNNLWFTLSIIISCGTLAAALIPELVKVFTSSKSIHCREVVTSAREGGASLGILSGFVAGNFSAFWIGMAIFGLMFIAYLASLSGLDKFMEYSSIFAFGLVAFGFLGMGPVTIAVDSYGPVTDNAQSIYELSLIETIPNVAQEIKKNFGFQPNFETAKHYLEENDSCGNTFKATAKPVLIGTAVVGATTMIFSLILLLRKGLGIQPETILNLLNPYTLLGFLCGGAVIYWFTGASMQAVTTGAYRAVQYIKRNIKLDDTATLSASTETSKEVVKICTQYAQKGMFNIFIVIFCFALGFAFFSAPGTSNAPVSFFISYLIAIAVFGLFQAIFMANAGGCWDNAKKVVEVDLKEKGTPLHAATVIGDTVGDPFKDTSSVAMNPIIKFTTLFGVLAMEIAISPGMKAVAHYVGAVFFVIALIFVARSFYGMRIPKE
ncbi:MAG: sodium-translocating pyrophosphatase [Deltaproteobacteria bacterium]|nr:sodium-translocating pyrophosphatase [Deltaproteobacteria bacterium]